jgi:hypothetical protein
MIITRQKKLHYYGIIIFFAFQNILDKNCTNDYKNYHHHLDMKTRKIILGLEENYIIKTRYNNTIDNIDRVAELIIKTDLLTTIKENQSVIADKDKYPSNDLVDFDPWVSKFGSCIYY